jgi:hypothetical protein
MEMKKLLSEANSGRVTNPGKEGKENDPAALAAQENCEATPHGRSTAESKPRADGQEPNRRPTWRDELAQHNEIVWYACGGKFGGSAVEQRAITWGDLTGTSP